MFRLKAWTWSEICAVHRISRNMTLKLFWCDDICLLMHFKNLPGIETAFCGLFNSEAYVHYYHHSSIYINIIHLPLLIDLISCQFSVLGFIDTSWLHSLYTCISNIVSMHCSKEFITTFNSIWSFTKSSQLKIFNTARSYNLQHWISKKVTTKSLPYNSKNNNKNDKKNWWYP